MEKLEKVIAALECCLDSFDACPGCYLNDYDGCRDKLNFDALEVIRTLKKKYATALEAAAIATELAAKARTVDGDLISRELALERLKGVIARTGMYGVSIEIIMKALPSVEAEPETDIYPLVIVCDRYMGTYSGGKYTAWNHYIDEVPQEIEGGDVECREFWWGEAAGRYKVGKGATVAAAIADLVRRMDKEVAGV